MQLPGAKVHLELSSFSRNVCVCARQVKKQKKKNKRRFPRNPASEPGALLQSGSGGPCEGLPGPAHGTKVVDFLVPLHVCVCAHNSSAFVSICPIHPRNPTKRVETCDDDDFEPFFSFSHFSVFGGKLT